MTENEMLEWISLASYEDLLRKNRFEPANSPWFRGTVGDALLATLYSRKETLSIDEQIAVSKRIGWGRIGGTDS